MDNEYVFGLDIGTRSIVGTVGYRTERNHFTVIAQVSKEHETRAVVDGQIHDIQAVSRTISEIKKQLEEMIDQPLTDVCIAAAGRVLKTKHITVENEFAVETKVTKEHVRSLDLLGIEKAYEEIGEDAAREQRQFYCVGYSIIGYLLNGYTMSTIEMHKANRIGVELIATFLPDEVVDGLYASVEAAGLKVANLTLEPIAAIQVAIPENFRLLNIALVDVGAGTSDISIVKDGSIIAFGMMPLAGDEMTEAIAKTFLIDFAQAEKVKRQAAKKKQISIKNILGEQVKLTPEDILAATNPVVDMIASKVSDKIIELNGDKPVSAVFIVGGGGKLEGFVKHMSEHLNLPESRVAIRGSEVLKDVEFLQKGIRKDSMLVTPIGICLNYYEQQNNFICVKLNEESIKLYDNNKLTVLDAAIQCGMSREDFFPRRGKGLNFTVNGQAVFCRGELGEPAHIKLNGEEVSLNQKIHDKDEISIVPSHRGQDASISLREVKECRPVTCQLDGEFVTLPLMAHCGDETIDETYVIREQDEIHMDVVYSLGDLKGYLNLPEEMKIQCGEHILVEGDKLVDGMELHTVEDKKEEDMATCAAEEGTKVFVNGTEVLLEEKENHIFVDVFDVYPFDLSKAGGHRLISRCNGEDVDFTVPIHAGDRIELEWS